MMRETRRMVLAYLRRVPLSIAFGFGSLGYLFFASLRRVEGWHVADASLVTKIAAGGFLATVLYKMWRGSKGERRSEEDLSQSERDEAVSSTWCRSMALLAGCRTCWIFDDGLRIIARSDPPANGEGERNHLIDLVGAKAAPMALSLLGELKRRRDVPIRGEIIMKGRSTKVITVLAPLGIVFGIEADPRAAREGEEQERCDLAICS